MKKILHVGAEAVPEAVSGVNNVIWSLAKTQSTLGCKIMLLVEDKPKQTVIPIANQLGIELVHIPAHTWGYEEKSLKYLLDNI